MLATRPITMLWRTRDEAGRRRDRDQPDDGADAGAHRRRLAAADQSKKIQPSIAAAEAVLVVAKASTAASLAASAEPALKPNQPNQSMPVPSSTYGMLAGSCASLATWLLRRPSTIAPARAAKPADMCTTVPPAKSRTPICRSRPCGCHVMCASGE